MNLAASVEISDELVEAIAERAAELVLERLDPPTQGPELLSVDEAAAFLRCKRQRVYDLLSAGRLRRYSDGARVLLRRRELEAHVGIGQVVPAALRRRVA